MYNELFTMKKKCFSVLALTVCGLFTTNALAFSLDDVAEQAKQLSEKPYVQPVSNLPVEYKKLEFADYQKIYFQHDKAYWGDKNTLFKLEFYHQGMYFDTPVKINEIIGDQVSEIKYDPSYFNISGLNVPASTENNLGFAGFKVHYPINSLDKRDDEIFTALGASYFRVIGKGQVYGLSARGLALDTGLMSGEEFPKFTEFWLEQPKPNQQHLVIYALLDSPRVTGAYRLVVVPGDDTTVNVEARVFFRSSVNKLGVAPLTSMYLYGSNQPSPTSNYRPAMHDSNGLSILAENGDWIWRPLNNPQKLSFSSFSLENPKGFGLIQRDEGFSDYEDLDDHYELRPSAWIEVLNEWSKGHVELVEIPTLDETNDNIVAFWVPEKQYKAGDELNVKYRLHYTLNEESRYPDNIAYAKSTRISQGDIKQANLIRKPDGTIAYVIDFAGAELARLPVNTPIKVNASISDNGEIIAKDIMYNSVDKGWRVILRLKVKDTKQATDIKVNLVANDGSERVLTETWTGQHPSE